MTRREDRRKIEAARAAMKRLERFEQQRTEGTVQTAPAKKQPSWRPTRKWYAAAAGAVASIAASWIVSGSFDDVERGMLGTAAVSLVAAYFKSNSYGTGGTG